MKIQSKIEHNLSVYAKPGSNGPAYLTLPAGATVELEDSVWVRCFSQELGPQLAAQSIVIVEAPKSKLTSKQILLRLKKAMGMTLPADTPHAELQRIAVSLGVDIT